MNCNILCGRVAAAALAAVVSTQATLIASAETLEWAGADGSGWTDAGNWQDASGNPTDWVDGSTAVFGGQGGGSIIVSGTVRPGALVFNSASAPVISGGTLAFPSAMPITLNDKGATISSALTLENGFVANFTHPCTWSTMLPRSDGTGQYDVYAGRKVTLWKNRTLTELTFKSANLYTWKLQPLFAKAYHPKWSDGKLTVQFQYETGSDAEGVYCAYVEFEQMEADISARVTRIKSKRSETSGRRIVLGDDWDELVYSGGSAQIRDENGHDGGIGIKDFVVFSSGTLALNGSWTAVGDCVVSNGLLKIEGGGNHIMSAGAFVGNGGLVVKNTSATSPTFQINYTFANKLSDSLIVDGAMYRIDGNNAKATAACGSGCNIQVINGGVLQCYLWAHEVLGGGTSSSPTSLYVGPNSTFWAWKALRNLRYVKTVVDGGTLKFTNNATTSCIDLTLRNGAQVVDADDETVGGLAFGDAVDRPILTVDGTNEVTVAGRIRILKDKDKWDANAWYTTIDTKQDLRLTGGLMTARTGDTGWQGLRVRKRGAAKMICDYSQDDYPEGSQQENSVEVCVDEGRLVLNKSNAIVSTQKLSLYGEGEVEAAADTSTSVGALTVGGTNTIEFAAGATLSCTGLTLNEGKRLELTNKLSDTSFRVGTTKCLSAETLRRITINGRRAVQTDDGYVVRSGLMILVR